jgi:hypothetical protein
MDEPTYGILLRTAGVVGVLGSGIIFLGCGESSLTDWVLTQEPEGTVLFLEVAIGDSCQSLDRIDVDESPGVVNISAYVANDGSNCEDILQIEHHEIELDQPLADRELRGCDPPGPEYFARPPIHPDCRTVRR